MKVQAWWRSYGTSAVSRTKSVFPSNKTHISTHIYLCRRRNMGLILTWSRLRTFSMGTSSMSSMTGRVSLIFRLISTRDVLATSGAQMVPSYSRVSIFCICFPYLVSDMLPDLRGRLTGENIIKASLKTTQWQFCTRPLVSAPPILSTIANGRRCPPILTLECPCENWTHQIDGITDSDDINFIVCAGRAAPDSQVRCHGYYMVNASIFC